MRADRHLPTKQSMRAGHKVRRFRRGNEEHGRAYLGHKRKPWKNTNTNLRSNAA